MHQAPRKAFLRRSRHAIMSWVAASLLAAGNAAVAAEPWQYVGVEKFPLYQPPATFTGTYRTQGIATDGQQWFFSWQLGLERADDQFRSVQRNSSLVKPGIPLALLFKGLNHIGDFDYHDGLLYVPLDSTDGYTKPHIALFKASDLSYTGKVYKWVGAPTNPSSDIATWVAVDPIRGLAYGKEWGEGNTINVYNLKDLSFSHVLVLSTPLSRIQGAKVVGDWLYMSADNSTQSVYRASLVTGFVEEVLQLPQPAGKLEAEGIALRKAADGSLHMYVEQVVSPDLQALDLSQYVALYHFRLPATANQP